MLLCSDTSVASRVIDDDARVVTDPFFWDLDRMQYIGLMVEMVVLQAPSGETLMRTDKEAES